MRRRDRVGRPPVPRWVIETPDEEAAYFWADVNGYDRWDDEILAARLSVPRYDDDSLAGGGDR